MDLGFSFLFFNILSVIVSVFVIFIFVFVFVMMIKNGTRISKINNQNNASPVLNVTAKVISKRTEMKNYRRNQMNYSNTLTRYFVTFEVQSGDRMEFEVKGEQSGFLMEGDQGTLEFQGTRYLDFIRE